MKGELLMKSKPIRVMFTLVSLVMTCTSLSSALTLVGAQKSGGGNSLTGTSWQLVRFQGPDERTFAPDDKSKYTITFGGNGRVTARVDCNRASSTWRASANGGLQFGSWSRTSAKCGPKSLHDQIVMDGGAVHNFVIKDGHLFLSGMAGGGYYELEPIKR
jgi:heat shock protein HslJ